MQAELNFNPLPRPGTLFTYGTQQYSLYSAFCDGPVTNIQMSVLLGRTASHTRRMCDIDKVLNAEHPGEFQRTKKRISKSIFEYRIIRIAPPRECTTAAAFASGEIAQGGAF